MMKKIRKTGIYFLPLLCILVIGCSPSSTLEKKENKLSFTTREGSSKIVIPKEGKQLFLDLYASSTWKIEIENDFSGALQCIPMQGEDGEKPIRILCGPNLEKERRCRLTAYLINTPKRVEIEIIQQGEKGGSLGQEIINGDISLMELPRLSGIEGNYFVTLKEGTNQIVNFSYEYDVQAHHSRWVAFSFDQYTAQKNVGRSPQDAFRWDPNLPSQYETNANDYWASGFQRGHLVASYDRVHSREANLQTFYYSNISPQRKALNLGIWQQFEQLVQGWGRSLKSDEVLYVAKGGTIREDQIEAKRSNHKIVVPKYYWMAIAKKGAKGWTSVGLLCEHSKPNTTLGTLRKYALSIDELEEFTGLDFFHNLPDSLEENIEKIAPEDQIQNWPGL